MQSNAKDSILFLKEGRLKHLHFLGCKRLAEKDTNGLMGLMGANRGIGINPINDAMGQLCTVCSGDDQKIGCEEFPCD